MSLIDLAIESAGGKRNTILYVPYMDSLFRLLEKSNTYISTVLKSAALLGKGKYHFVMKPFPIKSPKYEWYIAWHPRFDDDLAHQWLRNQIMAIFKKNKLFSE